MADGRAVDGVDYGQTQLPCWPTRGDLGQLPRSRFGSVKLWRKELRPRTDEAMRKEKDIDVEALDEAVSADVSVHARRLDVRVPVCSGCVTSCGRV